MNLKGRDFLTLLDYTPEEIAYLVDLAAELKAKKKAGVLHDVLRGKNVALIFERNPLPTPPRCCAACLTALSTAAMARRL